MTRPADTNASNRSLDNDQVMNLAEARRRLGNEELLRELAEIFFEDVVDLRSTIRDGAGDPDRMPEVRRAAHTLKGLSSNFGAQRTMKTAFAVECRAAEGDMASLPPLIIEMEREADRLADALRDAFQTQ